MSSATRTRHCELTPQGPSQLSKKSPCGMASSVTIWCLGTWSVHSFVHDIPASGAHTEPTPCTRSRTVTKSDDGTAAGSGRSVAPRQPALAKGIRLNSNRPNHNRLVSNVVLRCENGPSSPSALIHIPGNILKLRAGISRRDTHIASRHLVTLASCSPRDRR